MYEEQHLFIDMRTLKKEKHRATQKEKYEGKITLGRESTTLRLTEILDKASFI